MSGFDFRINPSDYLGIEHEKFKSEMLQLALSKPSEYFELRKKVLERVKRDAVNKQYSIYYWLLTEGTLPAGDGTNSATSIIGTAQHYDIFQPKLPPQMVNEFALKAAKTIDAIAEEAIEMILPMNYKKIADDRTMQKTSGTLGFD